MHRRRRAFVLILTSLSLLPAACGGKRDHGGDRGIGHSTKAINILAPAAPGGGWDQTARAMQPALAAGAGQQAQVYNVAGAGGAIGLAQFVNDHAGDPRRLMVGGLVMLSATLTNQSPVTLDQVTPIASLTAEWEALAVPADSPYQTFRQLLDDFKADPTGVTWAGGSAGGSDQILVGLIAKAAGVAPSRINYIAYSGGGEALAALMSGALKVGVSGVSEFSDQVEAGKLRWLAVASDRPLAGVDAPTIRETGLDVVLPNWRAVFAPPRITDEQRAALTAAVRRMRETPQWRRALEERGWNDFFKAGDEFAGFLEQEQGRVAGILRDIGLTQ